MRLYKQLRELSGNSRVPAGSISGSSSLLPKVHFGPCNKTPDWRKIKDQHSPDDDGTHPIAHSTHKLLGVDPYKLFGKGGK